jgi:hypothetical protein
MTNKDLSRELCEICGIEAKVKYVDCGTPECLQEPWAKCEICPEAQPLEFYPDFTQPENFVKLEEIMLAELAKQRLTVVKYVHYYSDNTLMHEYILITKCGHKFEFTHNGIKVDNWFVEREDRTECLILFILWKVLPICGESIKQAIKSEVWKYE